MKLLPCYSSSTKSATSSNDCSPGDLMTFDLPIRLQPLSDPVTSRSSLDAKLTLLRIRGTGLERQVVNSADSEESAFAPGMEVCIFGVFRDYSFYRRDGGGSLVNMLDW